MALVLVYLQTNRFDEAGSLFAGLESSITLPLWELMKSFGDERPYRTDWGGETELVLPFLQSTPWQLPRLTIEVNGLEADARIDTGGELLTLSPDVAAAAGFEPVVTAEGVFAAGARGEIGYGRRRVDPRSGPCSSAAVPAAVMGLGSVRSLGRGSCASFSRTLDYPCNRLVLRPRAKFGALGKRHRRSRSRSRRRHLLLARGSLDGLERADIHRRLRSRGRRAVRPSPLPRC